MNLNKTLVSIPLARFAFTEVTGATRFNRPKKSKLYSVTYTAETAMTTQALVSANEYLDVDQTKAVHFFIDDTQQLSSAYDIVNEYSPDAVYALKNEIDGKFFNEVTNAFYTTGKLDMEWSGANTDGITATASLMPTILSKAKALLRRNKVETTKPIFVVLEPMIASFWELATISSGFNAADTTLRNGYVTTLPALGLDLYVSDNLRHTITLTSTKNLAADDAIIVGWVTLKLKASPSVAGEIDVGTDEATTLANISACINGTAGAGTAYIEVSQDDRAKWKESMITATVGAGNHTIAFTTSGYVAITESVDSTTAYSMGEHQCISMMGQKGCVDMVIQKQVSSESQRGTSQGLIGTFYTTWTRYGMKSFTEGIQRMLGIRFKMG